MERAERIKRATDFANLIISRLREDKADDLADTVYDHLISYKCSGCGYDKTPLFGIHGNEFIMGCPLCSTEKAVINTTTDNMNSIKGFVNDLPEGVKKQKGWKIEFD